MSRASGRSSPSFVFVVGALVASVLAYGLWSYLRPSPHARSEHLVRELARTLGREVNAFRREMRSVAAEKPADPQARGAALESIDKRTEKAIERVEKHADDARDEMAEWDIPIRTQRNRNQRLGTREEEAKELIHGIAEETKAKLDGG